MKRIGQNIEVMLRDGCPYLIRRQSTDRRGRQVTRALEVLQVLDTYVVQGAWWAGEKRRVYWRVAVRGQASRASTAVVVIYEEWIGGEHAGWVLSGVED